MHGKKKFDTFVMDDTLLANISDTQVDEALNDEGEEQNSGAEGAEIEEQADQVEAEPDEA